MQSLTAKRHTVIIPFLNPEFSQCRNVKGEDKKSTIMTAVLSNIWRFALSNCNEMMRNIQSVPIHRKTLLRCFCLIHEAEILILCVEQKVIDMPLYMWCGLCLNPISFQQLIFLSE
jgi:hypothetical protein